MELTSLTNSLKIHLCMELFSQNISFTLTKYFRLPKGKKLSTYLSRAKKKKKERDRERYREKGTGMELASLGRSCKVESFPHSEKSYYISLMRSAGTEGGLWSLKGEHSTQFAEGKVERDLHRSSGQCQMTLFSGLHLSTGVIGGWVLRLRF